MPKIIGSSLSEHRERTRSALFRALDGLIRQRPFAAISLADIALEANVGRTSVYNHFGDKEDLLLAYIEDATSQFATDLQHKLAEHPSTVEKLRVFIREQLSITAHYHVYSVPELNQSVTSRTAANLRSHVNDVESMLRNVLQDGIADGLIPDQDLPTTMRLIHSCLSGRNLPDDDVEREQFFEATETFVLRAIGVAPQALEPGGRKPDPDVTSAFELHGSSEAQRRLEAS